MANKRFWLGMLVMVLAGGLILAGCSSGDDDPDNKNQDEKSPEQLTTAERWGKYVDSSSTATIDYSVSSDGVCAITVGGTAMNDLPAWDNIWKVNVSYKYTAVKDKTYAYFFEAWTDDSDRTMTVEWYGDEDTATYHNTGYDNNQRPTFTITSERKPYTITGTDPIPKNGVQNLEFLCANQTGTFYVKILSIMEETDRWSAWNDSTSTAVVTSEWTNDVLRVTVSGTPTSAADCWKGDVTYIYTIQKGATYRYVFNAWTGSGTRPLWLEYHGCGDEAFATATAGEPNLGKSFNITNTPTNYTLDIDSYKFPKSGIGRLGFKCADQTGTFYLKIVSITKL
jgi:hypothetical protein